METITSLSRRGLLQMAGGALVVRFALGQTSDQRTLDPSEVDSFLAIHADGSVTIYTSKVDVGTGLATAFRQTAAEELGIPVERFTVIEGDTAVTPNHGGTGGSSGIPRGAADIRRAAATARQALLDLGANQLNRPASELTISGGDVVHASGQKITVASLIGRQAFCSEGQPECPAEEPLHLHRRRQADTSRRCPRQMHREASLAAGLHAARHAAWPRGSAAVYGREAALGR